MERNDTKIASEGAPLFQAMYGMLYAKIAGEPVPADSDIVGSLDDLVTRVKAIPGLVDSDEIRRHKPLDFARPHIEAEVDDVTLARLLEVTELTFESFAESEPHWAVLTNDLFKADRIDEYCREFYESGESNMIELEAFADRSGIDLGSIETCFELGCGTGRVTIWLAERFKRVIAADVSARMLEVAEQHLRSTGHNNVTYVQSNKFDLFNWLEPMDVFFTSIVLQHNSPPVQIFILDRVLDALKPGGIALFQMISNQQDYGFEPVSYLGSVEGPRIEMHAVPQRTVFDILARHGCRLLEVREDGSCGSLDAMVSNVYFAQKTA